MLISPMRQMFLTLLLLLLAATSRAEGVMYIYRADSGSIWYTNVKPAAKDLNDYSLIGMVKIPTFSKPSASRQKARLQCGKTTQERRRKEQQYTALIAKYAKQYGVSAPLAKAVVAVESCFDHRAVSSAGAKGLMQLMPQTAKHLGVKNAFDHRENLRGGIRYLSQLLKRFDRNDRLALAAYNAGPEAVKRYKGIPPYRETRNYVKKVMAQYKAYLRDS